MSSTKGSDEGTRKRPERRRPDLDTVYTINEDGSRNFLHPADVKGRWQLRVNTVWTLLIAIYVGLPWIQIGGHPAIHIDLPGRQAWIFGEGFTNQDFYLVFFLLTGMGFGLFFATALFGRIWCGFACPQTVFMEGVFRRIERWVEGPRNTRIRRNMGPMTFDKAWRKGLKHVLFVAGAYLIAHAFLSYFIPVKELLEVVRNPPGVHKAAFSVTMFFTALMYFDYAWFREQTCLIVCPYGRIQSALCDHDTVVIGYDAKRGEPRSKGVDTGGDCIDCFRCVEVCPTGIDIRNGLQMECLGCTRCIDACDDIMRKIGKPEGLIRYDSERSFKDGMKTRFFRMRIYIYIFLGALGLAVATWAFSGREPYNVNVLRPVGIPYSINDGKVQNLYRLSLQNKDAEPVTLSIVLPESGVPDGLEWIVPRPEVTLEGTQSLEVPVFAMLERDLYERPFPLSIEIVDAASGRREKVDVTFRGP